MRYRASLFLALLWPGPALAAPDHLARIASESQFGALARTISTGRYASFPQMMFVIDRRAARGPRVYFVNSRKFAFHIDFVQQKYLSTQPVNTLLDASYSRPDRRFIFGSVVRYPGLKLYGVEFWEGDVLDADTLNQALRLVGGAFPAPLLFKPNSQPQIDLAAQLGMQTIDSNAAYGSRDLLVLNAGHAVGRLRIVPRLTAEILVRKGDILIIGEAPLQLSPVAGLISTEFSTPLSHVNLLAKSWRIPNGYLRNADKTFAGLDGKIVAMDARGESIALRLATPAEIAAAAQSGSSKPLQLASSDTSFAAFPTLAEQRSQDVVRTGAKAANLGEVARRVSARTDDFTVPPGFSLPFAYYDRFVRENGLDRRIEGLLADPMLRDDAAKRRTALAGLRAAFAAAPFDPSLLETIARRRDVVIGPGGVFARSSTNSEDLPGFNGAGLYTSVPNVVGDAALAAAIKTVWASVWNDAAFDAREAAGIDHRSVKAAVLIQKGMNADASGVMITENPFDPIERTSVFINAKRGLGIRVVEGKRVAEQLLYRPDPEAIQILTRSTDDAKLVFDANGGVRELPVEPNRLVLTDALARRLAKIGQRIEAMFGGKPQDIEWLTIGETIYIVQSRPYLRGN